MTDRLYLTEFALNDPAYASAIISVWVADTSTGLPTGTLATLYSDLWGSDTLANPQGLSSGGRWLQPVYVDVPVVIATAPAAGEAGAGLFQPL